MTLYRIWLLEAESGQKVTGPERRGQSIWEAIHRAVDVRPRGIQGWGQWAGETWVGVGVVLPPPPPPPPTSSVAPSPQPTACSQPPTGFSSLQSGCQNAPRGATRRPYQMSCHCLSRSCEALEFGPCPHPHPRLVLCSFCLERSPRWTGRFVFTPLFAVRFQRTCISSRTFCDTSACCHSPCVLLKAHPVRPAVWFRDHLSCGAVRFLGRG